MADPTIDGDAIFGRSVTMPYELNPPAQQVNSFFGVTGLQSLYGGLRGRTFLITGVIYGDNETDFNAAMALYESYVDGQGHTLSDTYGRQWFPVLIGPMKPSGRRLQDATGFYLPYQAQAVCLL